MTWKEMLTDKWIYIHSFASAIIWCIIFNLLTSPNQDVWGFWWYMTGFVLFHLFVYTFTIKLYTKWKESRYDV